MPPFIVSLYEQYRISKRRRKKVSPNSFLMPLLLVPISIHFYTISTPFPNIFFPKSMAKPALYLLLLLLLHFFAPTQTSALPQDNHHPNPNSSFIRSSCRETLYPELCIHTLSAYATSVRRNDLRLSQAALLVSLSRARLTTSFVARLVHARGIGVREFRAVKDCVENIGDSIDDLTQSVAELARLGKRVDGSAGATDFVWHMSNVQTWVSAALTDEYTCMDGFGGRVMDGNIKVAMRRRVVHLAQVTSNALALVNRFASRHRPGMAP